MEHAVLRASIRHPTQDAESNFGDSTYSYKDSALPEDLREYIYECYAYRTPGYHPEVTDAHIHGVFWYGLVPLHTLLNWIVAAGWQLSTMSSSGSEHTTREVYIFTRSLASE